MGSESRKEARPNLGLDERPEGSLPEDRADCRLALALLHESGCPDLPFLNVVTTLQKRQYFNAPIPGLIIEVSRV